MSIILCFYFSQIQSISFDPHLFFLSLSLSLTHSTQKVSSKLQNFFSYCPPHLSPIKVFSLCPSFSLSFIYTNTIFPFTHSVSHTYVDIRLSLYPFLSYCPTLSFKTSLIFVYHSLPLSHIQTQTLYWAMVVAQLAERSHPITEVRDWNPVIGKILQ